MSKNNEQELNETRTQINWYKRVILLGTNTKYCIQQ